MTSILFFAFLLLLFSHLNLRDRVKRLESLSGKVPAHDPSPSIAVSNMPIPPAVSSEEVAPAPAAVPLPRLVPQQVARPQKPSVLVMWFKEHTLVKIGGIFFFLGAAWFVSYAVKAGWLSPEIRILLGTLLALAAYSLGVVRKMRGSITEYHTLTALGTGIMAATVLAAHGIFGLIPASVALLVIAVAVAYTVYVAFSSRTLWLTICAAVLGLCAPFMTGMTHDISVIMPYLFVLSTGLLVIGLRANWRPLTFLLLIGVLVYELSNVGTSTPIFLFSFGVIFSLVFFVSTTLSLIKSAEPETIDITTLGILSVGYVYLAAALLSDATVAIFAATAVVAGVGYALLMKHYPARVVAIYLGLAVVGVLIGTSFLFSGYSLVLAYICEVTMMFLLVTHLGLPERAVLASAALYAIPFLGSLQSLAVHDWKYGVWHADAAVVYAMLGSLTLSTLWLIHKPGVAIYRSSQLLAAVFGTVSSVYAYAVIAVVASALFLPGAAPVMTYLLWAVFSVSVMYYALKKNLPLCVVKIAAVSLGIPVIASTPSFFASEWSYGVYHSHGFGLLGIIIILLLATLLITQQFCREFDQGLRSYIGAGIVLTTLYIGATLTTVWSNLLPASTAVVVIYVSYTLLLYLLTTILVLVRAQASWIKRSIGGLALPVLLSLDSFTVTGWPAGPLSPDAVGLCVLICVAVLLGLGLRHKVAYVDEATGSRVFDLWVKGLFVGALVYTVGLIWSVSHSMVEPTQAISLSLFIYTVWGLWAYLYGKQSRKTESTYIGIALLTIVVIRLLLVDVWNMEILWRVITLIGIGALFIGASLIERRPTPRE